MTRATPATRYERRLEAAADPVGTGGAGPGAETGAEGAGRALAAAFARAARTARAQGPAGPLRDGAAGVVGPMLGAYVLWILADARARGIRRLHFLARDGQVLHAIATRLGPVVAPEIGLGYLAASRQIWNRAISASPDHHWLWYGSGPGVTITHLLRRLAVPGAAMAAPLAALGFPAEAWDRPLAEADIARLRPWLAGPDFAAAAAPARAASRRRLLAHLAQEGVIGPPPGTPADPAATASTAPDATPRAAIVDLGWIGSLHDALSGLLAEAGAAPVDCYLFGIERVKDATFLDRRRGYFFDHNRGQGADIFPRLEDQRAFLEVFCAADHGTVTGLAETPEGRITAEVDPTWAAPVAAWGLGAVRATVEAFADALAAELASGLARDPGMASPEAVLALRPAVGDLLRAFWLDPVPAEARAWGAFPFNLGEGHGSFTATLAAPYGPADLIRAARGGKALKKHEHHWVEGALAATAPPLRLLLTTARRLRRRPAAR